MTATSAVILTADDYGLCDEVNQAIEEALLAGVVQTTSAIMNMPSHIAIAGLRCRFPRVSLGLHWNLSQGKPVAPLKSVSTLVDRDGGFFSAGNFKKLWRLGRIEKHELWSELEAQYARFNRIAGPPSYWNTHENVHLAPGLFAEVHRVALALGIRRTRSYRRVIIPRAGTRLGFYVKNPAFWLKGIIIAACSFQQERVGVRMPRALIHAPGYDKATQIEAILVNQRLSETGGVLELVAHPARRVVPDLFGNLTDSRVREYQSLVDPHLNLRLRSAGVNLAGFEAVRE